MTGNMSITRKVIGSIGLIAVIPFLVTCYLYMCVSLITPPTTRSIIFIIALIIMLGISTLLDLIRTLSTLHHRLNNIANGDFNQQVKVEKFSGVEDMAMSINRVSQRLRENFDALEKKVILIDRFNRQIKKKDYFQKEYFSDITHELRSPLINIDKSSTLLLEQKAHMTEADQDKFLRVINNNATHLIRLINNLLDISKIEAGQLSIKHELINIRDVINKSVDSLDRWSQNKHLKLEIRISPTLPKVYADRDRIIQVLINLLSNAIEFTPAGGKITVEARVFRDVVVLKSLENEEKFIEVSVKDTGIGIPDSQKHRIFERFKTADNEYVKTSPSTGLGLPIAKKIVQMHGGKIWVESQEGEGSKFTFIIPQGLQRRTEEFKRKIQKLSKKILLIDDEDNIRDLLSRELNKRGYFVAIAKNGLEGLRRAIDYCYDLVITDIRMPNVDGVDCIKILKKMHPNTFFMIITGFPIEQRLEEILKEGPYPCVKKPFDLPGLLNRVEELCSAPEQN